ncbi:hypothetical protein FT643_20030 [Ketobacter sp. MCCC 1A13808]|uniref:hypothetical protein n=1 Tax=Ketobacter sp. MCCC 1A13808 TaxID=2602738 RepID=UPI0012ECB025|nr:hypothetical protein [Ketobacter sp. MCCC 1A13808]MVF14429.1 hypothetical protein [Ketobacter sp. MCCC 1A13808]
MGWRALGLVLLLLFAPVGFSQSTAVPDALQPWIDWVLQEAPERTCPFQMTAFERRQCAWPGKLELSATALGLDFSQQWTLFSTQRVFLPGSDGYWPQSVLVNQEKHLVVDFKGQASIELPPGNYAVQGTIPWQRIPDTIPIPQNTGIVSLMVNQIPVEHPKRDDNGRLWLVQRQAEAGADNTETEDKLSLRVYRQLVDDIPFRIETHLELEVSGKAREMVLGKVLFDGFQIRRFDSPLPARIENDGRLRVQLRPGQWTLDLIAHNQKPVDQVFLENSEHGFWPEEEVWVFQGKPELRQVQVEGVDGIDPNQTSLPEAWKRWPAFRLSSGQAMKLSVLRRGDPQPAPNRLQNQRDLWLDFDGAGMTVRDRLQGTMTRDWRLNVGQGMALGRLTLDDRPQVITEVGNEVGVEVRQGRLNAEALSRFQLKEGTHKQRFPASGWQLDFDQLSGVLHLPPGWRAMMVSGVDTVSNTWISSWSVWDVFIVLIAVAAIIKLRGIWTGVIGGLSLLLIYPEEAGFLYLLLNLIAVMAMLSLLPEGRLFRFLRWYASGAMIVLVLWMLGFMVEQARFGMYPQLQKSWVTMGQDGPSGAAMPGAQTDSVESRIAADGIAEPAMSSAMMEAVSANRYSPKLQAGKKEAAVAQQYMDQVDPGLSAQTGPGIPSWDWQPIYLQWSGPVTQQEPLTVWLMSPLESRFLNGLRVVSGLLLLMAILGFKRQRGQWQFASWKGKASTAIMVCVLVSILPFAQEAKADIPDPELLNSLKQRLLTEEDCTPACLSVMRTRIDLLKSRLTVRMQVHAVRNVIWALPQSGQQWQVDGLLLDDQDHPLDSPDANSPLRTFIPQGEHEIVITGLVSSQQDFQLSFPVMPHNVELNLSGFTSKGLDNGRLRSHVLYFYPISSTQQQAEKQAFKTQAIAPFVRVERELRLGLNWYLETRVRRVAPAEGGISLEIPLLEGESVTTREMQVEAGKAIVALQPGEDTQTWYSALDKSSLIKLEAPDTALWSEHWIVNPSALWHLQFEGLPMVKESGAVTQWRPRWRPYPGEQLNLTITRPEAVQGATQTIDWIRQTWEPGQRESLGKLRMHVITSKGTEQRIQLPEQARIKQLKLGDELRSVAESNVNLIVPLNPGEHWLEVEWSEPRTLDWKASTPLVAMEGAYVNHSIGVSVPRDRWVLFVGGPAMGPAVLFWGILIVSVIIALVLGRFRQLPVKTWQWLLLILGLCAGWIEAIVPVVMWFWMMHMRQSDWYARLNRVQFNFMQVVLAIFSFFTFMLLIAAIPNGLVGSPDMGVVGNGSSQYFLNWFVDRGQGALETAWIISLPLWVYRGLMLLWSLWLVVYLLRWLKWGWAAFVHDGYWHSADQNPPPEQGLAEQ